MADTNKQMEMKSTEEVNVEMRRSFSWDRAFFTSDGFLDAEELSSMIEGGGGDDVKDQLRKIEEIESLEAKLFEEIEGPTQKSNTTSDVSSSSIEPASGKMDSQAKKAKAAFTAASSSSKPVKTPSSSGSSDGSRGKKVRYPARGSVSSKTGKADGDSPSKTSTGIKRRNNVVPVASRTPPASPGSSGSSSSMFSVNQRSKRSSSVPRRSSMNSEKPLANNTRKNDEWKIKNKTTPVNTGISRTSPASSGSPGSSSSTFYANQRSKRSSSVPRRSSMYGEKPSASNIRKSDEWKIKKNKATPINAGISRTPPASPVSSGSSLSTFSANQRSKRSSSVPRRSSVNSEKPSASNARKNSEWKTTKNKVVPVSTRMSRTPPASPGSSGSSSSTFSANQRSKRSSSVPRKSSVNSEKPSATDARSNNEWETSKPEIRLIPKTQSSISLKIKPPPVVSNPSSPSELSNSSLSSRSQPSESSSSSSSSSSTCKVNQRSKSVGRSKSTLKHHPSGQTPAASRPETGSPNGSKTRKLVAPKTVEAVNKGLKSISQKTTTGKPSKKQSTAKAKSSNSISRGAENIILVSPEVMDIKGKLNALKMEISMQKGRQMQGNQNEP